MARWDPGKGIHFPPSRSVPLIASSQRLGGRCCGLSSQGHRRRPVGSAASHQGARETDPQLVSVAGLIVGRSRLPRARGVALLGPGKDQEQAPSAGALEREDRHHPLDDDSCLTSWDQHPPSAASNPRAQTSRVGAGQEIPPPEQPLPPWRSIGDTVSFRASSPPPKRHRCRFKTTRMSDLRSE